MVGIHVHDVLMGGDRPERTVAAVREIVHGGFSAQTRKPGSPGIVAEQFRPTDVDLLQGDFVHIALLIQYGTHALGLSGNLVARLPVAPCTIQRMIDILDTAGRRRPHPQPERLELPVIWSYTLSRVGLSIMGVMFGVYLMKYATDVLLIAPVVMGGLLAAARLWDAVTDPLVGYLSDRTRSRFGRRRVWMYASAIPLGIGTVMIWAPPADLSGTLLIGWMALALIVYETASTAFLIPHGALGMELTPDYHERTRLFGYVHMIGFIGSVLGMATLQVMNMVEDKRAFAFDLSLVAGVIVMAAIVLTTRRLPERPEFQGRGSPRVLKSFFDVFRNPHARLLLAGVRRRDLRHGQHVHPHTLSRCLRVSAGGAAGSRHAHLCTAAGSLHAAVDVARASLRQTPGVDGRVAAVVDYRSSASICSKRTALFWILTFITGFLAGCGAVLQPAIQADVIDYDELSTSERKEGAYLAVWNLVRKCSGSLCALITGLALQASGFVPNIEQSAETRDAIKAVFGLLPAACYLHRRTAVSALQVQ